MDNGKHSAIRTISMNNNNKQQKLQSIFTLTIMNNNEPLMNISMYQNRAKQIKTSNTKRIIER